ncbi:MAG: hypothetical protein CL847_02025 [Crocinitomicaceae bacterium]|nr:hypothetical protein [Crocinitomicaceae bacterium]
MSATCYDCHSKSTNYPWYSNITPVSWWLEKHESKSSYSLNYFEWG